MPKIDSVASRIFARKAQVKGSIVRPGKPGLAVSGTFVSRRPSKKPAKRVYPCTMDRRGKQGRKKGAKSDGVREANLERLFFLP
ncbi:hypothetical protein B5F76_06220 [Desulfovibrio sp. An276]|nr:hypothetical protein B5F76_06220 [Desulfovibrio sp. An276]